MAKRKLSFQQRQAVRQELSKGFGAKKKTSELLQTVADKYGITTVTARWYLKSIKRPSRAIASPNPKSRKPSSKRQTPRKPGLNGFKGSSLKLVQQIQLSAEKRLKRALEVKKLLPQWQTYIKKEASLRNLEIQLKKKLRSVGIKTAALHRRIRGLSSV